MCLTIGTLKTLILIIQYPALILMPTFSIWTFGNTGCTCLKNEMAEEKRTLKPSFRLAWGNLLITSITIVTLVTNFYVKRPEEIPKFLDRIEGRVPPLCFTSLCYLFSMIITLLLLQFLSYCHVFGCHNSICYPIVQKTELDPENPFDSTMETNKEEMKELEEKEVNSNQSK